MSNTMKASPASQRIMQQIMQKIRDIDPAMSDRQIMEMTVSDICNKLAGTSRLARREAVAQPVATGPDKQSWTRCNAGCSPDGFLGEVCPNFGGPDLI